MTDFRAARTCGETAEERTFSRAPRRASEIACSRAWARLLFWMAARPSDSTLSVSTPAAMAGKRKITARARQRTILCASVRTGLGRFINGLLQILDLFPDD